MFYKNGNMLVKVDQSAIERDLAKDSYKLVTYSRDGELVIDRTDCPDYPYRREVYQYREDGEGINLFEWGGLRWEFCRSIKVTD